MNEIKSNLAISTAEKNLEACSYNFFFILFLVKLDVVRIHDTAGCATYPQRFCGSPRNGMLGINEEN
jgi:hypothetical protein